MKNLDGDIASLALYAFIGSLCESLSGNQDSLADADVTHHSDEALDVIYVHLAPIALTVECDLNVTTGNRDLDKHVYLPMSPGHEASQPSIRHDTGVWELPESALQRTKNVALVFPPVATNP